MEFLGWANGSQGLKDSAPCSQIEDGEYRGLKMSPDGMRAVKWKLRRSVDVEFLCAAHHCGEDTQKCGYQPLVTKGLYE